MEWCPTGLLDAFSGGTCIIKVTCDQSQHQMSKWIPGKKKNPVIKNQGWEPIQQKYKANEYNTSRHNQKKKQKQTINKNAKKIHDCEMTINQNKEDLRRKSCHLPQIS
jgi:hypothetical protein